MGAPAAAVADIFAPTKRMKRWQIRGRAQKLSTAGTWGVCANLVPVFCFSNCSCCCSCCACCCLAHMFAPPKRMKGWQTRDRVQKLKHCLHQSSCANFVPVFCFASKGSEGGSARHAQLVICLQLLCLTKDQQSWQGMHNACTA